MKKPKIEPEYEYEPLYDNVLFTVEEAKLGALDTSSIKTGVEWGVITALGEEVQNKKLKIGDRIHVKAWGVDSTLEDGITYYYTSEARRAICGKKRKK